MMAAAYGRLRGVEAGDIGRLSPRTLGSLLADRGSALLRGLITLRGVVFRGRGIRIRGKRNLTLHRYVVLGDRVQLSAVGGDGIRLGEGCTVDTGAILRVSGVLRNLGTGITVGPRSAIGAYNLILGQGGVTIGSDVLLGPGVTVVSENHNWREPAILIRKQGESRDPIVIEDDCWVGASSTILAGARIGRGAVVAANSVVRGYVEPFSVYAGSPARKIASRGE